jgi:acyl-CoA synthetase (AMP-forming)/AMP-acid ligase II
VIGGSACPPAMIKTFRETYGVDVIHAWGMTELSPLGTLSRLQNKHLALPEAEQQKMLEKQGHVIYGIDMKIVDDDGRRTALGRQHLRQPAGARSLGDAQLLQGRGRRSARVRRPRADGWFPTGDVATIDSRRLHADHRPQQGRDQVRRRMDQLDRSREPGHRASGGRQCGGDRRGPPEVGRAAPADRRASRRARSRARNCCWRSTRARSPSGGCPTTCSSSTRSRWAPPARS